MKIQINTEHALEGHQALAAHLCGVIENALGHLADHITRIEVHLSDENGEDQDRGQNDKRCLIEAHLDGCRPLAVTAHAATVHQSVVAAADKLARLVEGTLGRLHDHRHRRDALPPEDDAPTLASPSGSIAP